MAIITCLSLIGVGIFSEDQFSDFHYIVAVIFYFSGWALVTYASIIFLKYDTSIPLFYPIVGFTAVIMLIFTMIAQFVNYSIGYFIKEKIFRGFVKNKELHLATLKKYDFLFIIVLNILPLPADILTVILGMVKYDFWKAMFYTTIGKLLKFLFLGILILIMQGLWSLG